MARRTAQPQKGRLASGALVTAVSKSVHERACVRARASRHEATRGDARRGACLGRISEVDASRSANESWTARCGHHCLSLPRRRKSRGVIEADRERVQKEKDRSESERERERVSSALVAPGHRPRCSKLLQAGFGPRTRSDGTAIFPNCGHAPANEKAT